MEENMIVNGQELVETAVEQVTEAVANAAPTAVAVTTQNVVPAVSQPKSKIGKTIALDAGIALGSFTLGVVVDHWAVPKIQNWWGNHKAKKAEKKAARDAKKAAKGKGKKQPEQKAEPATKPAEPEAEGIDPNSVDTTI